MKTGTKVIIIKPGIMNGITGVVLFNDRQSEKSYSVHLDNGAGVWQFKETEVSTKGDNASQLAKTSDTPKPEIVKDVIDILEKVGFKQVKENEGKQKRKYTRRGTSEVKVTKRKYNKKPKS